MSLIERGLSILAGWLISSSAYFLQPLLGCAVVLLWSFRPKRPLLIKAVAVLLVLCCVVPSWLSLRNPASVARLPTLVEIGWSLVILLSLLPVLAVPLWLLLWAFDDGRSLSVRVAAVASAVICWACFVRFLISPFGFILVPLIALIAGLVTYCMIWTITAVGIKFRNMFRPPTVEQQK